MKRCPECLRDYFDDSILFCLDDGSALFEGPALREGPPTVKLSPSEARSGRGPSTGTDTGGPAHVPHAIAVLPFANLGRGEDAEYFSDGLAEELLSVLSKIKGLRVVARTSAFSFKGKRISVEEIGRSLRVGAVLEGSVRVAGEHIRIAVRLVDVGNGYHLWSETYDRSMEDIFAIQDDIARSVVGQLRSRFLGETPDGAHSRKIAQEVDRAVAGRCCLPEGRPIPRCPG